MHHVDDPAYMTAEERATEVAVRDVLTRWMNLPEKLRNDRRKKGAETLNRVNAGLRRPGWHTRVFLTGRSSMKKSLVGVLALCGLVVIGLVGVAVGNSAVGDGEPAMMVSPSTIVLAKVDAVTVHTNIPASTVEVGSLDLDGAAPTGIGVDSCGHIVIKFAVADLALTPGEATLTLTGTLTDGSEFSASDVVTVK